MRLLKRNLRLPILVLGLTLSVVSCAPNEQESSDTNDLVYDRNATNIAMIFGVPDNLQGVHIDLREMPKLLSQPEFHMKVYTYQDKSPSEIARLSGQHAQEVGENGTLLFYFSGHGAQDGSLFAYGGMLDFTDVVNSIKQSRSTPLKRFITVVDACFSGNLVDGSVAVSNNMSTSNNGFWGLTSNEDNFRAYEKRYSEPLNDLTNENIFEALRPYVGQDSGFNLQSSNLYEQLLVFSASRKTETSLDSYDGGLFTTAFRRALTNAKSSSTMTIKQLIDNTVSGTQSDSGNHHTPVFRAEPEQEVLNDLVFGQTNPSTGTGTSTSGSINGLVLGLGADQGGTTPVFIAAPANVTEVALCRGDKSLCTLTAKKDVLFKQVPGAMSGGNLFVSKQNPILQAGTYTILGIQGFQVTASQGVSLIAQ